MLSSAEAVVVELKCVFVYILAHLVERHAFYQTTICSLFRF